MEKYFYHFYTFVAAAILAWAGFVSHGVIQQGNIQSITTEKINNIDKNVIALIEKLDDVERAKIKIKDAAELAILKIKDAENKK